MTPAMGALGWLTVALTTITEVIQRVTISELNNKLTEKKEEKINVEE
jgi:hypothetical protein